MVIRRSIGGSVKQRCTPPGPAQLDSEFTMDEVGGLPRERLAPLPLDLSELLELGLPNLWRGALEVKPRLRLGLYDEYGGTHGKHYRKKRVDTREGAMEMAKHQKEIYTIKS